MGRPPSGTVTFLFSDVEGSTRLWDRHPETMKGLLAEHDEIMGEAIENAGGYVFSTAGDAYSVAFATPVQAIEAAVDSQARLVALDDEEVPIRVRMAIHSGTADEREGDYFGQTVNRAARLMSVGNGRQVLVSRATAELTHDSLPEAARLEDLGQRRLRDLSRPEQVYKLSHPSIPDDSRPLRSMDAYPHNLPVQLTSFVGREEEVAEVIKLLGGSRMVTLAGVGGAGKTRLAVQTAAEMLSRYADGVFLVELAPLTDQSKLTITVMDVLGIEEKAGQDPLDTVVSWLADKEMLLILDNCEHLVEEAAGFAARALGAGAGLSILATSREMLGVPGEYPFQVKSLASPDSVDEAFRSVLMRYPAVRLFAERGELARPGWRITADNAPSVVQICRRLDGMPLAIELAAARLRMMRTEQIADRLDDRFRLLTGGSRTVLPRQQTLEAAIDWSFDLLSDEEKVLFSRLAVFMGGFTLEAAEAVCGLEPLDQYMVLDNLGHLVDKSLVLADERPTGIRYRLLETLRQYARDKLAESEEVEQMRHRHADYFRALAEEAEGHVRGRKEDEWFSVLDDELDNLRQAMGWSLEAPLPEIAQAISGSLYRYFMYRFRTVEGRQWAQESVATSTEPTYERAKALLAAGTLAQAGLNMEVSMGYLDESLNVARRLGADDILGPALNNRANVAAGLGRWEEAEDLYLENLDLARRLDRKDAAVISLVNLANRASDVADHALAVARAEEAVEQAVILGSDRLFIDACFALVEAHRHGGAVDAASAALSRVLEKEEEMGRRFYPGRSIAHAAMIAMDRDDYEAALPMFLEGVDRFRGVPDPYDLVWVVHWMLWAGARVLCHSGEPGAAARFLGAADSCIEAKGFVRSPAESRQIEVVRRDLEAALGQDEFKTAYEKGRVLEPGDALDRLAVTLDAVSA